MIRNLFETYVIRSSTLLFDDMADEFYMQIYRQCNFERDQASNTNKDLLRPMLLILVFLSRYMVPSENLIKFYEGWLLRKKEQFVGMERLFKQILVNFRVTTAHGKPEKGLYVCWPPSVAEI